MNVLILLTFLCLEMVSAAPKVDHSVDAQRDLRMVTPGAVFNTVKDSIHNAALEKSPEALEKDNQEQSEEEQSFRTAMNDSGYISLRIKIAKGILGVVKDEVRKAVLEKIGKKIGKRIMGGSKKPQTKKDFANVTFRQKMHRFQNQKHKKEEYY